MAHTGEALGELLKRDAVAVARAVEHAEYWAELGDLKANLIAKARRRAAGPERLQQRLQMMLLLCRSS